MAFLFKKYSDGSYSVGYETGETITLSEKVNLFNMSGKVYNSVPKGTKLKVRKIHKLGDQFSNYAVQNNDHSIWRLCHSKILNPSISELKPNPPKCYYLRWHESEKNSKGKYTTVNNKPYWKVHQVWAFSESEVVDRFKYWWINVVEYSECRLNVGEIGKVYTDFNPDMGRLSHNMVSY